MSLRPLNLVLPYEVEMHKYLSQDDYGSPHVTRVIDYVVTENTYVLVLEHPGKDWVVLDSKRNVLYNEKTGGVKLMNFGHSGPLEKWNRRQLSNKTI
ncbi:hypothetical protein BASA61_004977 [Batrachochytrium salamandrivorans]|nr:hypothetical protein BASA61_004977 [Batrachochytrium salamandrivorans]